MLRWNGESQQSEDLGNGSPPARSSLQGQDIPGAGNVHLAEAVAYLVGVEVWCWVLVCRFKSSVFLVDHRVKQLLEHLHAHTHAHAHATLFSSSRFR